MRRDGMRKLKFQPRNINEEMPPLFPYDVVMRNVVLSNGGRGGLYVEGANVLAENLTVRRTPKPVTIRRAKKVCIRGLNIDR